MGVMKDKHIEHMNEVDFAEAVQKDLAEQSDFFAKRSIPQHVIDEEVADASRQRAKELKQMDMFNDPDMNWSGLR
tara:strand:+ start:25 stop:249 length:225 start_codon:yes stop_codon:yes gene_type:complete